MRSNWKSQFGKGVSGLSTLLANSWIGPLAGAQHRGAELCRESDVKHRTAGLNPPSPAPAGKLQAAVPQERAASFFAENENPGHKARGFLARQTSAMR